MSLIIYGFNSGKRYVTESIEYKINLLEKELICFKKFSLEKKIILKEKELIKFKKEIKIIKFFTLQKEVIQWKIL